MRHLWAAAALLKIRKLKLTLTGYLSQGWLDNVQDPVKNADVKPFVQKFSGSKDEDSDLNQRGTF